VGQNVEGKSLDMFLCLKVFVNQSSVETIDTGIESCMKDHLLNLRSGNSNYCLEALNDKYKWIMDLFLVDSP
jgi:hypothetical protein